MNAMKPVFPARGMLLYGDDVNKESPLALGMVIELPPMDSASIEALNCMDDALRHLLLALGEDYRLQIRWSVGCDYEDLFEQYHARTLECRSRVGRWVREERLERHQRQQAEGTLRRERLIIYVASKGGEDRSQMTPGEILVWLRQQRRNLEMVLNTLPSVWNEVRYEILDDLGNFREWYRHQNPSSTIRDQDGYWENAFDPESSFQWMTENSDARTLGNQELQSFYMDGCYQSLLVLREWPGILRPGDIRRLTGSVSRYFSIVQNIRGLSAEDEIDYEIASIKRLRRELSEKESGFVHRVELERRQEKLESLQAGRVKPFKVLTVMRVWGDTEHEMHHRLLEVKTALEGWGARYFQMQQVAQLQHLFLESFPGNLFSGYRGYDLYATSDFMPSLLPASSTFVGTGNSVNEGEILLEGDHGNLCTLNLFIGDSPQNAVVVGTRGSGKSVLVDEILGQSGDRFDFICIVEEGLSHEVMVRLMGAEPIVISPDCGWTLNYLDTRGLPLTQSHLAFCRAITMKMCGLNHAEQSDSKGEWIHDYIQNLYWDFYRSWVARRSEVRRELMMLAYMVDERRSNNRGEFADVAQLFREIREWKASSLVEYTQHVQNLDWGKVERYASTVEGDLLMRNLAYAFFTAEEFPCHRDLVELMKYQPFAHHPRADIEWLSSRLNAWTRDEGVFGPLLDGVGNLPEEQRILYFELGQIPESAKEVKDLVAFILTSIIRQEVIRRPRSQPKAVLIEEAARFREIPGGDKILAELYAQMRKFNCWVLIILQQYAQIRASDLKSVIFGNSNQIWLLRNNDRDDLEDIAASNDLPDTVVEIILRYPLPEHQQQEERSGYFFFWDKAALRGGTIRVRPCPEMLYIASSGGQHFEQRRTRLAQYENLWQGVCAEARVEFGRKQRQEVAQPEMMPYTEGRNEEF